tara:strand:- start:44 stop:325 length:282 start_codon:yes stop_codon:yes gene_type:complete
MVKLVKERKLEVDMLVEKVDLVEVMEKQETLQIQVVEEVMVDNMVEVAVEAKMEESLVVKVKVVQYALFGLVMRDHSLQHAQPMKVEWLICLP